MTKVRVGSLKISISPSKLDESLMVSDNWIGWNQIKNEIAKFSEIYLASAI